MNSSIINQTRLNKLIPIIVIAVVFLSFQIADNEYFCLAANKNIHQTQSTMLTEKSVSLKASLTGRSAAAKNWWNKVEQKGISYIKAIRTWSSEKSTRIVIEFQRRVRFKAKILPNPDRFYVDLYKTVLHPAKRLVEVNDGIVKQVRASQNTKSTARIVVDLEEKTRVEHFRLSNPPRLVIDVFGTGKKEYKLLVDDDNLTLSKQLGLKVKTIVLDPGHGGKDGGAKGRGNLLEKKIALDIAKRTKELLEQQGNYRVLLTRDTDKFIPLESRTAFANQNSADLFISIHANGFRSRTKHGIETFYLSPAKTSEDKALAALENAMVDQGVSDLEPMIKRMLKTIKKNDSEKFAEIVQKSLIKKTGQKNRGVKTAPFVVLIGTNMPSVLVEVGFISNQKEAKLFQSSNHRYKVARALCDAVMNFHN